MRALVAGPGARGRLAEVPEPVPGTDQALVEVRHVAVNHSELRHMDRFPAGTVLGYDAAGIVIRPAEDGTGPGAGARVAAFGAGAWAERAAFGTDSLAVVPAGVSMVAAAALPMAGITALRALRAAGVGPGSRVLVTGASGAVGRLAVRLAALAGAYVIASTRRPAPAWEGLVEPVTGLDGIDPVDAVIELVGGPTLVAAWGLLKPGGNLQSIGWAAGQAAVFPPDSTFSLGTARSLHSFGDVAAPAADLAHLLGLMAAGELSVEVGWHGSWERLEEARAAQLDPATTGKITLAVGHHRADEIETLV
ncbi:MULTISPECIES: zinc-binding dehydrogenase [unclassified Nonomuraea]|uniref:zinc-binding dehydrogenase n=1 Tax=unclassified Nonomuraea TaxID=2593643 RepID=UPI0035C127E2